MGISCQINLFKPPNTVFQPGDVISGVIKYVLSAPMEVEKIIMSLKGSGVLEIRVPSQNIYRSDDYIQSANETYVDIDNVILDSKTKVPAGSYDLKFDFTLPYSLPSSFIYQNTIKQYRIYCRVKYYIRIKFERPGWFATSKHFRKEIFVVTDITPKLLMQPIIYGKSKKIFRFFSKKNAIINIKATIQNSVISIGGKIHIDFEIKNDTNVVITSFETQLMEVYTFKVQGHSKIVAHDDVKNTGAKIGPIDCGLLKPLTVEINVPVDKVTIQNCKVVKRDYIVRTKAILPMPHRNVVLDIPVQIGPLKPAIPYCMPIVVPVTQSTAPPAYWQVMTDAANRFTWD